MEEPVKWIHIRAKQAARLKGLEFNIERCDIILPECCPVFGMKLTWSEGKRKDSTASLDRVDNTKGYVKGNIKVVSWKANRLKSNATLADLRAIVKYMEENNVSS